MRWDRGLSSGKLIANEVVSRQSSTAVFLKETKVFLHRIRVTSNYHVTELNRCGNGHVNRPECPEEIRGHGKEIRLFHHLSSEIILFEWGQRCVRCFHVGPKKIHLIERSRRNNKGEEDYLLIFAWVKCKIDKKMRPSLCRFVIEHVFTEMISNIKTPETTKTGSTEIRAAVILPIVVGTIFEIDHSEIIWLRD